MVGLLFAMSIGLGSVTLGQTPTGEAEKHVRQLGSKSFAERESAEKALRVLGAKAYAAVRAGSKSPIPEIVQRCEALLPAMQRAVLRDADHPARKAFLKAAGNTKDASATYEAITARARRCEVLEVFAANPEAAGRLYGAELKWHYDEASIPPVDNLPGSLVISRSEIDAEDHLLAIFLGCHSSSAAVTFPKWVPLTRQGEYRNFLYCAFAFDQRTGMPAAQLELLTGWAAIRTDPAAIGGLMMWACEHEGKAQLVPLARTLAAKEALPASARAQALLLLGGLGDKSDMKLCEALFTSTVVVTPQSFDKKQPEILAADVAYAAALVLRGKNPGDFGYVALAAEPKTRTLRGQALLQYYFLLGFADDKSRIAARVQAKAFLATNE